MKNIILSIKPEFVEKILSGEKKYEYRKKVCKEDVEKIYIYATAPIKMVVGEVEVIGKKRLNKEKLWEKTQKQSGITKEFYDKYFVNCEEGSVYCLGKIIKYEKGKLLQEFGVKVPPQSFVYYKDS